MGRSINFTHHIIIHSSFMRYQKYNSVCLLVYRKSKYLWQNTNLIIYQRLKGSLLVTIYDNVLIIFLVNVYHVTELSLFYDEINLLSLTYIFPFVNRRICINLFEKSNVIISRQNLMLLQGQGFTNCTRIAYEFNLLITDFTGGKPSMEDFRPIN